MKTKLLILTGLISIFIIKGCTTSYYLKPINNNNDLELMYFDGKEVVISKGYESGIAMYGTKTAKNELVLHILYMNNTMDNKIDVIPEQVTVAGYNEKEKLKYFKVYPAEEYLKKMLNSQAWVLALQGASAAYEAGRAGKTTSTTYGTVSGNLYGSDGVSYTGSGSLYTTTTTYDYAKQAEANARNRAEIQETAEQFAQVNSATEQGLIKSNTLMPGQYVEGDIMVKMDMTFDSKFIVTIPVGNETHIVTFIPKK